MDITEALSFVAFSFLGLGLLVVFVWTLHLRAKREIYEASLLRDYLERNTDPTTEDRPRPDLDRIDV